ncbi:MAG: aminoglycoside phosphotransferase family protein [Myxococcota bacterium]
MELRRWIGRRAGAPVDVEPLVGGASLRRYWRVRGEGLPGDAGTVVLMTLPAGGPASEELGLPGASAGEDFVAMARWLEDAGLPVPTVHEVALDEGVVMLEDLGDRRLFDDLEEPGADRLALYEPALGLLVAFQAAAAGRPGDSPGHARRCDAATLRAELDHFLEYGLEARQGRTLAGRSRGALEEAFDDVAARLAEAPYALAHRDFQSQNLMVTLRGLVVIDFQDAFVAPAVYDLVALLRDSYVVLARDEVERLLDAYHARRVAAGLPRDPLADRGRLEQLFHLQTIQRKLKDAGRFEFIDKVKGNPAFLRFYADSVAYAVEAMARFREYGDALGALCAEVPEAAGARGRRGG